MEQQQAQRHMPLVSSVRGGWLKTETKNYRVFGYGKFSFSGFHRFRIREIIFLPVLFLAKPKTRNQNWMMPWCGK
jgi:hypothetical protein